MAVGKVSDADFEAEVLKASGPVVVDFKTNHSPPTEPAEIPEPYVPQLALYRAVLARLYPRHGIRAALLWTETPEFMEIFPPALDAALASLDRTMTALDPARPRS